MKGYKYSPTTHFLPVSSPIYFGVVNSSVSQKKLFFKGEVLMLVSLRVVDVEGCVQVKVILL
jgi:hypothetical protein